MSTIQKKFKVELSDDLFPVANLVRDFDHYAIGPHTDIPERVTTLLFYLPIYLPTSTSQINLGTSLYRPVDPHFTCSGLAHYPFDAFIKTGQAPFLPNSVLGFLRNDRSFHGVEPIGVQEKERNLLGYTVWKKT